MFLLSVQRDLKSLLSRCIQYSYEKKTFGKAMTENKNLNV